MFQLPVVAIALVLAVAVICLLAKKRLDDRLGPLERELRELSSTVNEITDLQMNAYQKLSASVGQLEEGIMELAVPSQKSNITLERRHKVLALARQGIPLDEIVKRLNTPRAEAEFILSLRKSGRRKRPSTVKTDESLANLAGNSD